MQNPIKTIYNFIKNFKQYHAVHVCIWPTFAFFILLFCLFIGDLLHPMEPLSNNNEIHAYYFGTGLLIVFHFLIFYFFTLCAVIVEAIILIIQIFTHKKIRIKDEDILNDNFFNIIFIIAFFVYLATAVLVIKNLI